MAYLRKRYGKKNGKRYLKGFYAEFYDPQRRPKQKYVSLRTKDETAARQKLATLERLYAMGEYDPWTDKIADEGLTVAAAVDRFVKDRKKHCSDSTVNVYEYVLKAFSRSCSPNFPLYGVTEKEIESFLVDRTDENGNPKEPLKDATKRNYTDRLRIFFSWCVDQGMRKDNPVPDRRSGKQSRMKGLPEFLTEKQFNDLLLFIQAQAAKDDLGHGNLWIRDAMRVAVGTGLRRGELCNLRWSAVDMKGGMLKVKNTKDFSTKSGRERSVPIVGDALKVLQRLDKERTSEADGYVFSGATGGTINGGYLSKQFRHYRRKAGLPGNINFHSLRHTFASWFVMRGGDLYRLKEIMGHADMKTTLKYAHLRPDALRDEMEKTFGSGLTEKEKLKQELERLKKELAKVKGFSGANGQAVT